MVGVLVFELGLIPLILGIMWSLQDGEYSAAKIVVRGYVTMLALFCVVAVPMCYADILLSRVARIWLVLEIVIVLVGCVLFVRKRKVLGNMIKELWRHIQFVLEHLRALWIILVIMLIFSAMFVVPSMADDTGEIVGVMLNTDRMYAYAPYTLLPYGGTSIDDVLAPLEVFYAVATLHSGMKALTVLHIYIPMFLLVFFYALYWCIGRFLFRKKLEYSGFLVIMVSTFCTTSVYGQTGLINGVFQNIWNAVSLVTGCGVPLCMLCGMFILKKWEEHCKVRISEWFFLILTFLFNQLMLSEGCVLAGVIYGIWFVIWLIRKVVGNGINIGKYKK